MTRSSLLQFPIYAIYGYSNGVKQQLKADVQTINVNIHPNVVGQRPVLFSFCLVTNKEHSCRKCLRKSIKGLSRKAEMISQSWTFHTPLSTMLTLETRSWLSSGMICIRFRAYDKHMSHTILNCMIV